MSAWNDPELRKLFLTATPLIDVRAPVEFNAGSIPHSINLPILNDDERHLIGTCYKEQGQAAAIELGHKLVFGDIKAHRIQLWTEYLQKNPHAEVFCFRGGLRSQLSCEWITNAGIPRTPIKGGYKRLRNFFLSHLNDAPLPKIIRLAGLTGSGKTHVLRRLPQQLDLEELAHHRGSAFGALGTQPSQVTFENHISLELLKNSENVVIEDESVTLGNLTIPLRLYRTMIQSPMVVLKVDHGKRVLNIFEDYVKTHDADFFLNAVDKISRHFGGHRTQALKEEIHRAFEHPDEIKHHEGWISTLLLEYYDPFYKKSLQKQKELIIFEGNEAEVESFLTGGRDKILV